MWDERLERTVFKCGVRLKRTALEGCFRERFQCVTFQLRLVGQCLQCVRVLMRQSFERAIFATHLGSVVGPAGRGQGTGARAGGGVGQAVRGRAATSLEEVHALVASPLGSSVGKPNLSVTVNKRD